MKKYFAFFRIRFTHTLQYRSAALAGVLTQFVWGLMECLAFTAFYQVNPAAFPITLQQTIAYIWLQQAFLSLYMLWFFENDFFDAITTGNIAYDLARPLNLYTRWFCQASANRLAKAVLRSAPFLVIVFLLPAPFRMFLPANWLTILLFLFSTTLSLGVVVAISMLIYTTTFYTLSSLGVRVVLSSLGEFLSGGVIPLPFFPDRIRTGVELLPFASIQNTPLLIYTEQIQGVAIWQGIGLQLFWLTLLTIIGYFWMQRSLTKITLQGG